MSGGAARACYAIGVRLALLLVAACGPAAPSKPARCPWHDEITATRRCASGDPRCGPDTLYDCLDALHYDPRASRHVVEDQVRVPGTGCVDDGQCAVVRGCGPFRCGILAPPRPPGTPMIDPPSYTCGVDLQQEELYRKRFCGCVQHSCAWFTQ